MQREQRMTQRRQRTMKNELRVALFRITFAGIGAFVAAAAVGVRRNRWIGYASENRADFFQAEQR